MKTEYHEQRCDDIEQLFGGAQGEDWQFEYLQLTPGSLGARNIMATVPELSVHWYRYTASLHAREYHQKDAVFLTFLLSARDEPKWFGKPFAPEQALLYQPRQEQDYVLPRNIRSLGVMIDGKLIRRMDWSFREFPVRPIDMKVAGKLMKHCRALTACARLGLPAQSEAVEIWRERLIIRLGDLLSPWLPEKKSCNLPHASHIGKRYRILRKALCEFANRDPVQRLNIDELAEDLCTSPRSLYRTFRDFFGIGPYEYYTLTKLRTFRRLLHSGTASPRISITDLALRSGFQHLGRFAQTYQTHYEERPRETAQRILMESGNFQTGEKNPVSEFDN